MAINYNQMDSFGIVVQSDIEVLVETLVLSTVDGVVQLPL